MIVLITNDDGYDADGMQEFVRLLEKHATCYVVAPDAVRSCASHAVTTASELHIRRIRDRHWTVSGTPADCVRIGLRWLEVRPDWVLSGVNEGGNLGVDIHYSGTVAGAREARLLGFPSMAFSQYLRRDQPRDWMRSAQRAWSAFHRLHTHVLGATEFWNVNLPVDTSDRVDLEIATCEPEPGMLPLHFERIEIAQDEPQQVELERVIYRSNYQARPRSPESDVGRCFDGVITATRLDVHLIASQHCDRSASR